MSDIQERLEETSKTCIESFEAWLNNKKESGKRENLQESIHELRKVISRLEIEIAISERDNSSNKPIPIPTHRSHNKKDVGNDSILPDNGHTDDHDNKAKQRSGGRRPRKTISKKQD